MPIVIKSTTYTLNGQICANNKPLQHIIFRGNTLIRRGNYLIFRGNTLIRRGNYLIFRGNTFFSVASTWILRLAGQASAGVNFLTRSPNNASQPKEKTAGLTWRDARLFIFIFKGLQIPPTPCIIFKIRRGCVASGVIDAAPSITLAAPTS